MESVYRFNTADDKRIDALASNKLWFSKLNDFNDPFEASVALNSSRATNEDIQKALNKYLEILRSDDILRCRSISKKAYFYL